MHLGYEIYARLDYMEEKKSRLSFLTVSSKKVCGKKCYLCKAPHEYR